MIAVHLSIQGVTDHGKKNTVPRKQASLTTYLRFYWCFKCSFQKSLPVKTMEPPSKEKYLLAVIKN